MKRNELIEDIFDILNDEKLKHQNTTLSKASLWSIGVEELRTIYRFLSQWTLIVNTNQIIQRPECPIKHIKQQNQATVWYKNSMIQYLERFWLVLWHKNPCNYTPGFLERVSNRCELILKK